jgi:hypothetical protein
MLCQLNGFALPKNNKLWKILNFALPITHTLLTENA